MRILLVGLSALLILQAVSAFAVEITCADVRKEVGGLSETQRHMVAAAMGLSESQKAQAKKCLEPKRSRVAKRSRQ